VLFFFSVVLAFQVIQPYPIERYDIGSGLSSNIVYDIYQDKDDYIWVATENGLNRFDAYEFEIFRHNPGDSLSISGNVVRTILEDGNGNLWIGTINGLNFYEKDTGEFTLFRGAPGYEGERIDLQHLFFDVKGDLWFVHHGQGIWRVNTKDFTFHQVGENWSYNYHMISDANGTIWYQHEEGGYRVVNRYDHQQQKFEVFKWPAEPFKFIMHVGQKSGKIWLDEGPTYFFEETPIAKIPDLPGGDLPYRILEDRTGRLWIGTVNHGVYIYYPETGEIDHLKLAPKEGALSNYIWKLFEDKSGRIWIGTRDGLFVYDPFKQPFQHLDPVLLSDTESLEPMVMAINESQGGLWAGIFSEGLYYIDSDASELQAFQLESDPTLKSSANQIWSIFHHPNRPENLWVGTSNGLYQFDTEKRKGTLLTLPRREFTSPVVFSIIQADESSIWVAGDETVHLINTETGRILNTISLLRYENLSTLQSLYLNDQGHLFIGTEGIGLFLYNTQTEVLEQLSVIHPDLHELSRSSVWTMTPGTENTIWLGTSNGLYELDIRTMALVHHPVTQSGSGLIVYSILPDNADRLWLGTNQGLAMYIPETKESRFHIFEGIIEDYNRRSALEDATGRFWFGMDRGFRWFYPSKIEANPLIPKVHITKADVFSRQGVERIDLTGRKLFDADRETNTFEFHFTALNYTSPEENQFRYQLVGLDKDWVEAGTRRFARYTQLSPGRYTFNVQASNNDGIWNTEGATLSVYVAPEFWQTPWFKILIVLIVGLALGLLYRYRINKLIEMERLRLRIASDLHDEIGSGLSGIALSSDLLNRQLQLEGAPSDTIQRITTSARKLADSLEAIVWLIDPQKDTLDELVLKLTSTANELLIGKSVEYHIEVDEGKKELILPSAYRRNLYLLIKEAIHNISKHSDARNVRIELETNRKEMKVCIEDDGMGFDVANISPGNGLETMKRRAEALGSAWSLQSKPGGGTQIKLSIKLP